MWAASVWLWTFLVWFYIPSPGRLEVLTPPYFNVAKDRHVFATATCGEGIRSPEIYCNPVRWREKQVCDFCDPSRPDRSHPPQYAVDGKETWWQSPPLTRGTNYNEVNFTINLGQEFDISNVNIKMANSLRPDVWVLERSADFGATYQPWQYFSDTKEECRRRFGEKSLQPVTRDDSVICVTPNTRYPTFEPNEEINVSLLLNRTSDKVFFNSPSLQQWTKATNVRFRFLHTLNKLEDHLAIYMHENSVLRKYFYAIEEIYIEGRCQCNGHANACVIQDPDEPGNLMCRCQHNTCGPNCDRCCPGFEKKAWSQSRPNLPFVCEEE